VLINVNQRTGAKIVLIPSLCQMTGLTDSMRSNFQMMKEMAHTTHADARRRVQECRSLLDSFNKNEKCMEAMKEWQINIDSEPTPVEGHKLSAGCMMMGRSRDGRVAFDIESC